MNKSKLAIWFLRIGLAFVFIYASIEIYLSPDNFLKYIPRYILDIIPINLFLHSFGIAEVLLAVWLLSGWKGQYPSFLSLVVMVGIVVFNMEYFQVLFRNVAIAFGALALLLLEMKVEEKLKRKALLRKLPYAMKGSLSSKESLRTFIPFKSTGVRQPLTWL